MHFQRAQHEHKAANLFLTDDQKRWLELQKLVYKSKPNFAQNTAPSGFIRRRVYRLVNHTAFDIIIMVFILLNMFQMALVYEGADPDYIFVLEVINLVFTAVFALEMILKVYALGPRNYWRSGWNRFDFFVVMASGFDIFMTYFGGSSQSALRVGPQLARVIRVLRISRLFRLVKSFEGLQSLIQTMLYSLPALLNVASLLMLIFFIYAVLATYLFYNIKSGEIVDNYTSFENFGKSLVTLFRVSTGEDWNVIMYDCIKPKSCRTEEDCSAPLSAPLFFLSFIIICSFVMLNLFILVILQEYDNNHRDLDNPVQNFKEYLESFQKTWSQYTQEHSGIKMKERHLVEFFHDVDEPLGMGRDCERRFVVREIMNLDLKADHSGLVYFNELLYAAAKRRWGNVVHSPTSLVEEEKMKRKLTSLRHKFIIKEQYQGDRKGFSQQVNPFFSMMYLRITLRCWHHYTIKLIKKGVFVPSERKRSIPGEIRGFKKKRSTIGVARDYSIREGDSSASRLNPWDHSVAEAEIHDNDEESRRRKGSQGRRSSIDENSSIVTDRSLTLISSHNHLHE
mmetsp:Transcript_45960/g.53019  ORF Transcript_45960/g.53019 Transcript_45960/m.53019 type:complete len:566 (+) Transcript_45960:1-1698(+)